MGTGRGRIWLSVLGAALAAAAAPASSRAEVQTGTWSGSLKFSASGDWDYTIGYRGESERRSQAKSNHTLSWTAAFDAVRGSSQLTDFTGEGTIDLTQFNWTGSATSAAATCGYSSSGSMSGTAVDSLGFSRPGTTDVPTVTMSRAFTLPVQSTRSECTPDVIFGFSGPNAATLGDDGGYDVFLLNPSPPEANEYPRLSLCTQPETFDGAPTPETDAAGRRAVKQTVGGTCSGRRVESFGDSDVHHDSSVTLSYVYDLTFKPDTGACADGLDNDGDGTTDAGADPGCESASDDSEYASAECDNGVDDDGDGGVDFRSGGGDPDCESLTDLVEQAGCETAGSADRHTTILDVPARLNLFLAPDPDVGTLHMSVPWCMSDRGPRIMTPPDSPSGPRAWWDGAENWALLGALEAFGALTVETPEPEVVHDVVSASVRTSLNANLDAVGLVLGLVPGGKLFKPLKKRVAKHAKKLNPLAKRLKRYSARVAKARKEMAATGAAVRSARRRLAEAREAVRDTKEQLASATTQSEKERLASHLAAMRRAENAAKRVERSASHEHQAAIRQLRRVKAHEEKAARDVDAILKKIRKADGWVDRMKKALNAAVDRRVDAIHPEWAREVVRELVKRVMPHVMAAVDAVHAKLRELTSRALLAVLESRHATKALMEHLKSTYTAAVRRITAVHIPVWDANFTVSFDQEGRPTIVDNSESRLIFTILTTPDLRTTD